MEDVGSGSSRDEEVDGVGSGAAFAGGRGRGRRRRRCRGGWTSRWMCWRFSPAYRDLRLRVADRRSQRGFADVGTDP